MYASMVPKTALMIAASADATSVSRIGRPAPGLAIALRNVSRPSPNPFVTIATTGTTIIATR